MFVSRESARSSMHDMVLVVSRMNELEDAVGHMNQLANKVSHPFWGATNVGSRTIASNRDVMSVVACRLVSNRLVSTTSLDVA
jgi:hypothetical protein